MNVAHALETCHVLSTNPDAVNYNPESNAGSNYTWMHR